MSAADSGPRTRIALIAAACVLALVAAGLTWLAASGNGDGPAGTKTNASRTDTTSSRSSLPTEETSTSLEATSTSIPATTARPTTTPPAGNTTPPTTTTTLTRTSGGLRGRVIVVDPGHNGANGAHPAEINRLVDAGGFQKACNTTGTAEGGFTESAYNWQMAQRLREELQRRGATVVLTRTSDDGWGPCVDQRGLTAQRSNADAIVSIHADGAAASAHGFHVIHAATGPTVTAAVDAASSRLATSVSNELRAGGFSPSTYVGGGTGTVRRSDIATLNRAGVPGVMLESGNMHNPADLARLRSTEGQQTIATAIADALASNLS